MGYIHASSASSDALLLLHRPPPDIISLAQLEKRPTSGQQRLALEELIAHHLTVLQLRYSTQQHQARRLRPIVRCANNC